MVIVVLAHAVQWPFFNPSADFCDEPVVGWVYMAVIYGLRQVCTAIEKWNA